jgi:hypothetical protein
MFKCRLLWFLAFTAAPLIANSQVSSPAENTAACVPQAYIANLLPIFHPFAALPESAYEKFHDAGATNVWVTVLVTIGPEGRVTGTEALGGPEFLRKTSTDTVRHYKYQPVIRNNPPRIGSPNCAAYFAEACGDDQELRREVDSLPLFRGVLSGTGRPVAKRSSSRCRVLRSERLARSGPLPARVQS